MSKAPFPWPSTCPARKIYAMASSARMKQFESQLQQKNATLSIVYNKNHEEFSQNHDMGKEI